MNTNKHTPGPWNIEHDKIEGIRPICQLYHPCGDIVDWPTDNPDDGDREAEANAALIAACPDLLSACVAALEALNTAPRFNVGTTTSYRIASQVEAAIAKAGGQK